MQRIASRSRVSTVVIGALLAALFGIGLARLKGTGSGVRYAAGNLSAPWLMIPCWCAVMVSVQKSWSIRSAATGAALALISLISFYSTVAVAYHLVNSHTALNNLAFLVLGTIGAGVAATVAGRLASTSRQATVLIGLIFLAEPVFSIGYALSFGSLHASTEVVALLECGLGLALVSRRH